MDNIRPATEQDIQMLMGDRPRKSGKLFTVLAGEQPVALIGYYMDGGAVVLISSISEDARKLLKWYPRDVVRCSRWLLEEARKLGMPIAAGPEDDKPGAKRLLEFMGFRQEYNEVHIWHGSQ